eukprot:5231748-Prymnesium_polylepis.1
MAPSHSWLCECILQFTHVPHSASRRWSLEKLDLCTLGVHAEPGGGLSEVSVERGVRLAIERVWSKWARDVVIDQAVAASPVQGLARRVSLEEMNGLGEVSLGYERADARREALRPERRSTRREAERAGALEHVPVRLQKLGGAHRRLRVAVDDHARRCALPTCRPRQVGDELAERLAIAVLPTRHVHAARAANDDGAHSALLTERLSDLCGGDTAKAGARRSRVNLEVACSGSNATTRTRRGSRGIPQPQDVAQLGAYLALLPHEDRVDALPDIIGSAAVESLESQLLQKLDRRVGPTAAGAVNDERRGQAAGGAAERYALQGGEEFLPRGRMRALRLAVNVQRHVDGI